MSQSRTHSAIEAATNVIVGLAVAMGVQYLVFPLFGIQISHSEHFAIAAFFVVASIIRSYALRRLFNRWHREQRHQEIDRQINSYEYPEEPFR